MVRKWGIRVYVFQGGVNLSGEKVQGMALGVNDLLEWK